MKIVLIGDFHIPARREKIPDWILNVLKDENPNLILCTGDLESEAILNKLKEISKTVCVRGNMDWLDLPEHETIDVGGIRIGLIHGTGIYPRGDIHQLDEYADRMGANILVHGHTHRLDVLLYNNRLFLNPGTATGSWGGATSGEPESFIILDISDKIVQVRKFIDKHETDEEYVWNGNNFRRRV